MITCLKCKKENPSVANYCMICGNAISDTAKKRIFNLQKIERTKTYRELYDKIKTLERTNSELETQNNEVKKDLINTKIVNENINKDINELKIKIRQFSYSKPLESKDYTIRQRGEYVFLIITLFFLLLIILLVILKF